MSFDLLPVDLQIILGIAEPPPNKGVLELSEQLKITPQYLIRRTKILEEQGYIKKNIVKQEGKQGKKIVLEINPKSYNLLKARMKENEEYIERVKKVMEGMRRL